MWTGPAAVFVRLGFEIARESLQYPVLRKKVSTQIKQSEVP